MRRNLLLLIILMFLAFVPLSHATPIIVDQIIWQPDIGFDGTDLSAAVEFIDIEDPNIFKITLANTSGVLSYDHFSSVLLTGLGFNLLADPNVDIDGGSISDSDGVTYDSNKWGYDNAPLDSGPFKDVTTLSVNTVISTMESATEPNSGFNGFNDSDEDYKFKGPDYGILDPLQDPVGGLTYIVGPATILVDLNINYGGKSDWDAFFQSVNDGYVVVSFGSPTSVVPEPATMLLVGFGLLGLGVLGRKKLFKKS